MTALGFLYPGHSAEDDYPRIEQLLGSDVRLQLVHTDMGRTPTGSTRCARWARRPGSRRASRSCGCPARGRGLGVHQRQLRVRLEGAHEQVRALAGPRGCPPPPRPSRSRTPSGRSGPGGSRSRRPIRRTWRTSSPRSFGTRGWRSCRAGPPGSSRRRRSGPGARGGPRARPAATTPTRTPSCSPTRPAWRAPSGPGEGPLQAGPHRQPGHGLGGPTPRRPQGERPHPRHPLHKGAHHPGVTPRPRAGWAGRAVPRAPESPGRLVFEAGAAAHPPRPV